MAHGGDGFLRLVKFAHDVEHAWIQAQILGRAATGDDQAHIIGAVDLGKISIEGKIVAGFFAVGLRTFKVVDGGFDAVARFFVWAHRIDLVAHAQ